MSGHDISKREKTNEDIYLLVRFYVKTLAYYQDRFNCICFFLVPVIGEISVHPNEGYSLLQYCARTAAHSTFKLQSFVSVIVGLRFTVVFEFFQFDLQHWKSRILSLIFTYIINPWCSLCLCYIIQALHILHVLCSQ